MNEYLNAINLRTSRREYLKFPIEEEKIQLLKNFIDRYNKNQNYRLGLVLDDYDLFKSTLSGHMVIDGAINYFTLIAKKDDTHAKVMLGYWGEHLVLDATNLGLSTCWVTTTYDKNKCKANLALKDDEDLMGIILVGYARKERGMKEQITYSLTKRKTKKAEQMYKATSNVPDAFVKGMNTVVKAPSSGNHQAVMFKYEKRKVYAKAKVSNDVGYLDLGVALFHFVVGANSMNEWKLNNDEYTLEL